VDLSKVRLVTELGQDVDLSKVRLWLQSWAKLLDFCYSPESEIAAKMEA